MKKLPILLSIVAVAAIGVFFALKGPSGPAEKGQSTDPPENPGARMEWELMRHCDPATGKMPYDIRRQEALFVSRLPGAMKNGKATGDFVQSQDWARRGPSEIGGRTRALALDVMNESIILAGGVSGGMWRSTDGGGTWNKSTTPLQLHSVSCVAQDTRIGKENTWYYGTGEFYGNSADISGDGIFKSVDGGKTWLLLPSTTTSFPNSWENKFDYIWRIVVNHKNTSQDEVFAATALGGIYRSTDGGSTWNAVLGGYGNNYSYFTELIITPSGVFYATMSEYSPTQESKVKGIFRSVDGVNWTDITPQDMPAVYKRIVPAYAPSDENIVYFVGDTPGSGKLTTNSQGDSLWHSFWKYTYISGDGSGSGGTWENRSVNIPKPDRVRHQFNSQGSYDLTMKVKPDDPETVIIGGVNLYRTTDGLKTSTKTTLIGGTCPDFADITECFYEYRYPNHHADQHEIVFSGTDPDVLYTGSDGGVHKTLNCLSPEVEWISLNNSYFTTQFYTCAVDQVKENDEIIGGMQDNGTMFTRWNALNYPWSYPTFSDGFHCAIANNGEFYLSSNNSSYQPKIKIWKYNLDKNGNTNVRTRIDPVGGRDFLWNTPFKLDPNNSKIMYLCGGRLLWRNSDLSLIPAVDSKDSTSIGWDSLNMHTSYLAEKEYLSAVEISKKPANVVYYGTTKGHLFKLTDAASASPVFENVTGKNFPSGAYVSSIAINPDDASKVFVTFSNYNVLSIFYSTDGGKRWTAVSGNLEERVNGAGAGPAVHCLEIVPVNGKYLYLAGTSTGLFSTTYLDSVNTVWQMEGAGTIGNMVVNMIDSRDLDDYVAVATHGGGMYNTRISGLTQAPVKPVLIAPADNARGVLPNVTLSWEAVPGAYNYKLEIDTTPDFSGSFRVIEAIDSTSYTLEEVEQGYKYYYWRVTARNSGGISEPSASRSFVSAIISPTLLSPSKGASNVKLPVTLEWKPVTGAVSYSVQVAANFGFTDLVLDTTGIAGSTLVMNNADNGKKYYWKVSAADQDGSGLYSSAFYFATEPPQGVDDRESSTEPIVLTPNPVKDMLHIFINVENADNNSIKIYDISGGIAGELHTSGNGSGTEGYTLPCMNMQPGTYFVVTTINKKQYVRKFVVVK